MNANHNLGMMVGPDIYVRIIIEINNNTVRLTKEKYS